MPNKGCASPRRRCLLQVTAALGAAYTAAYPFLASFAPSARALTAGAPVEVEFSDLVVGAIRTVAWRGKPVWLLKRSPEMLATLGADEGLLADPTSRDSLQPTTCVNRLRSIRPELLVAVGVCTHLGSSPTLRLTDAASEPGRIGREVSGVLVTAPNSISPGVFSRRFRPQPTSRFLLVAMSARRAC